MEEKTPSFADVTLGDYIDMLRRRKGIIIQTFLLVLMIGTVVTLLSKPVFRSTARILVEGKSLTLTTHTGDNPLDDIMQPDTQHDVGTQIEILQGQNVLAKAYEAAHVPFGQVKLDVKQYGFTDVVDISVNSSNAKYAEQFARTLPETYETFLTGNRRNELKNALKFAQDQLDASKALNKKANRDLETVRNKYHVYLTSAERASALAEKTAAEQQLQSSETNLAIAQTKLQGLQKDSSSEPTSTAGDSQITNPQILLLKQRINDLKTQKQSLAFLFKETNPKVAQINGEIADLEQRLAKEPPYVKSRNIAPNVLKGQLHQQILDYQNQVASLQTEVQHARARRDLAMKSLMALGSVEPIQAALEDQVEQSKTAVVSFSKTVEQLGLKDKMWHDPVTIIAPGSQAIQVEPKKMTNILFSAFVGLLFGFGLALLMEFLDDRVSNTDEAQRMIGAPTLGYIPVIEDTNVRLLAAKSERKGGSYGGNTVLESYRLLRTNLQFSNVDRPVSSLMVTSALPGEGKSITAVNLATAFAMAGRRVLLVDADLRRPSLHTKMAVAKHPGLTNVLLGTTPITEAIQETGVNNLRILTSGLLPPNPAELFGSNAMLCLHQDLQALADIVIWDTPPVLAAADAQVLSANVDGVLFVLQHGMTRKSALRHATQVLKQARANILGIVFNRIDPQGKRDEHYYSYYQYYQSYTTDGPDRQSKIETRKQFEALVSNGAAPSPRNGSANGADQSEDDGDEIDGAVYTNGSGDGLVEAGGPGSDALANSAVVAAPAAAPAKAKSQNPMERTVVLPTRSATPGQQNDDEK